MKKIINLCLFLLLMFCLSFPMKGQTSHQKVADDLIRDLQKKEIAILNKYPLVNIGDTLAYVFNYKGGGYAIIANDFTKTIIGFSDKGYFFPKQNFTSRLIQEVLQREKSKFLSDNQDVEITPLLSDVWGGVNCIDQNGKSIYATNIFTPQHCSAGCVAISACQIMNYYEWPKKGMGNQVYNDKFKGTTITHSSFFDQENYQWSKMSDLYYGVASTNEQRQAVSKLFYDVGVALQMDYELSGSTSNINKVPFVLEKFFRFTGHYKPVTWNFFWNRLYNNITNNIPVQVGLKAKSTGAEHAVIIDGYKKISGKSYYHINWGWWNNNNMNGYYNIQAWNSNSGGYNSLTGAVFDFLPTPEITGISKEADHFIINWDVSNTISYDGYELQVKKDKGNWETISKTIPTTNFLYQIQDASSVYLFRVRSKVNGVFYANSWSNQFAVTKHGTLNGYISFNGNHYAYARQTPDDDLDFSNNYTFEFWIRVKGGNQNYDVVMDQKNAFTISIDDITSTSYSIKLISRSSNQSIKSQNNELKINEWVHVAFSHSNNNTKIFINGKKDIESNNNFNLNKSNSALNLGEKYRNGYSNFLIADLDQIRISKCDRYQDNFIPHKGNKHIIDEHTISLFDFDQPHKVRLKDKAYALSFIVKNKNDGVLWEGESLSNNFTPVINCEQKATINTKAKTGDVILKVAATDKDQVATIYQNWLITEGNENNLFEINAKGEILLKDVGSLSPQVCNLKLTVSDGKYISNPETVKININQASGIQDSLVTKIRIYPNPSSHTLNIENCRGEFVKIYNYVGKLVKTERIKSNLGQINISDFPKGVYFLSLKIEDNIITKKIIKK